MATERLQIVLDAAWRGGGAVKAAERDLGGVNSAAEKTQNRMGGLVRGIGAATVALGAVAGAAAVAWRTIGEGAALERSRDQFDRLAESINTTGDAMLVKLKAATNGLMSDAELVAQAGQIMSLGLQDTEDGVVRLTAVAGKLGWDMSQVILTMANDSVMRLDALGLSVENVNEKMRRLMSEGFSKGQAFDLAVIEAGEEKIELVGDAADTTAGKIQAMETAWKNVSDAFKSEAAAAAAEDVRLLGDNAAATEGNLIRMAEGFGRAVATVIGGMTTLLQGLQGIQGVAQMVGAKLQGGIADVARFFGMDEAAAQWDANAAALTRRARGNIYSTGGYANRNMNISSSPMSAPWMGGGTAAIEAETSAIDRNREAGRRADQQRQEAAKYIRDLEQRHLSVADATDTATRGMGSYASAIDQAAEAMRQLSAESGNYFDQARKMKDFNPAEFFYQQALAAGASAAQLAQVLSVTGLESPERIAEILQRAQQMEAIRNLGAGVAAGGDVNMLWAGAQASANPAVAANLMAAPQNYNTAVNTNITINGPVGQEQIVDLIDEYFRTKVAAQPRG